MCSVLGGIVRGARGAVEFQYALRRSSARGRDSFGYVALTREGEIKSMRAATSSAVPRTLDGALPDAESYGIVASCRAEPTTEWVEDKRQTDIQPFAGGDWVVAHNGTVANDKELSVLFDLHPHSPIDSAVLPHLFTAMQGQPKNVGPASAFEAGLRRLKGSFGIVAMCRSTPETVFFACNYRPLYIGRHIPTGSVLVVSDPDYFCDSARGLGDWQISAVPPYSVGSIFDAPDGPVEVHIVPDVLRPVANRRVLAICSGGLDSTVVAASLAHDGMDVTMLHFDYGCRATAAEDRAIAAVSERTGWPLVRISLGNLFTQVIGGSPLTSGEASIEHGAGGAAGAEFAHEWVPARNTVMLAIATAYAEAHGFDRIALGANIEEAGAYPDNEHEFIRRFNALTPYAVAEGKRVEVMAPVATMTKREIVALGQKVDAPMDLTWSCYHQGERHCGTCGPCYMRRRAFEMNGLRDPVFCEEV